MLAMEPPAPPIPIDEGRLLAKLASESRWRKCSSGVDGGGGRGFMDGLGRRLPLIVCIWQRIVCYGSLIFQVGFQIDSRVSGDKKLENLGFPRNKNVQIPKT